MENKEEGNIGNKIKENWKITNYQKLNIPGLI